MMNKKRILHIVSDDKFIDNFRIVDERLNLVDSTYLVKKYDFKSKYKYLKLDYPNRIIWKRSNLKKLTYSFDKFDSIIFHSLDPFAYYLLNKIPKNVCIYWMFWGFELNFLLSEDRLYFPMTKKIISLYSVNRDLTMLARVRKEIKWYRDRFLFKMVLSRVNFFVTWCKNDYEQISTYFPNLKYAYFCYYSSELLKLNISYEVDGRFLILGNSANPSNNHIDAMEFLAKSNFKARLIVPFSYGGDVRYKDKVKNIASNYSEFQVEFIDDFLSYEDYNLVVSSALGYVFFHRRQQAAGNFIMAFFLKKYIFYYEESTLTNYLISIGFILFKLDSVLEINHLNSDYLESNYTLAKEKFSLDESVKNLGVLYNLFKN